MILIEREGALAQLDAVVAGIRGGSQGQLVLVSGEAGAGKTVLVRAFLDSLPPDTQKRLGMCDHLRTARPFGPIRDWLAQDGAPPPPADGSAREEVFDAALRVLGGGVTVAVVEDVHWADEATLDALRYLARRLDRTLAALVLTYRDDEVTRVHPLTTFLGELAILRPVRVPVEPLSVEAIGRLAGPGEVDSVELHARTGGNAFFVTESLSSGGQGVPRTVRDAVLARADGLSEPGRRALNAIAIVPNRAELWLVRGMGVDGAGLDECVDRGVLLSEGDAVRFRHELAREAIHDTLLPDERQRLHARALAVLEGAPDGRVDHARAAHHAVEAGDVRSVLAHVPRAARVAAAAGARREAVAHLELVVEHAGLLSTGEQLDLWSQLAEQRHLLGAHDESVDAYRTAIDLATQLGDDERRGALLAAMYSPLSMAGRLDDARRAVDEAIASMEGRVEGPALALAYAQRCSHHMLARELKAAEPFGEAAVELAQKHHDDEVLAYTLIQSGVARWIGGDGAGLDRLRRGIDLAAERGLPRLVVHGLSQVGSGGGEIREYAVAVAALEQTIAYADRHELGSRGLYAQAWLGRCQVELGRWDEAARTLAAVMQSPRCDGITRMTALTALGRLRARRGDHGVWAALDEAHQLARSTGQLQRLWPLAAARAEAAWLEDRLAGEVGSLAEVYAMATDLAYPWAVGELGFWLWRAEVVDDVPGAPLPYALHIAGRAREAAQAWEALGCPYEAAAALADSPEDDDQLGALARFEGLGAAPATARLVARRRSAGRPVPRGPNAATRGNAGGLTDRESDVLGLVAAGYTNPEIAERLHISRKTVGHHLSHAMTKLGARSRAEAVAAALRAGVPLDA